MLLQLLLHHVTRIFVEQLAILIYELPPAFSFMFKTLAFVSAKIAIFLAALAFEWRNSSSTLSRTASKSIVPSEVANYFLLFRARAFACFVPIGRRRSYKSKDSFGLSDLLEFDDPSILFWRLSDAFIS